MITAQLNNYRQSPRKVRVVANLLKGKQVDNALTILKFTSKRASGPIASLVESAIANGKANAGASRENLFVKEIRVDQGVTMHRRMPRARGSAYPINKRTSHVSIVLEDKSFIEAPVKSEKKAKTDSSKAEAGVKPVAKKEVKKVVKKAEPKTK